MDKLGNSFLSFEGPNDGSSLKNTRAVGLYFGADWCDYCQRFNPTLMQFYEHVNTDIHQFEIVYVGMDQKQSIYNDSVRDMPWIYYDWKDPIKYKVYLEYRELIKEGSGIPCLIILNPNNGSVVTTQGRGMIEKEGVEAFDKWLTAMSFK